MNVPASTPAPVQSHEVGSATESGAATQIQSPNISPIIEFSGRPTRGSRQVVVSSRGSVFATGSSAAYSL